jgi:hypothetical protein
MLDKPKMALFKDSKSMYLTKIWFFYSKYFFDAMCNAVIDSKWHVDCVNAHQFTRVVQCKWGMQQPFNRGHVMGLCFAWKKQEPDWLKDSCNKFAITFWGGKVGSTYYAWSTYGLLISCLMQYWGHLTMFKNFFVWPILFLKSLERWLGV